MKLVYITPLSNSCLAVFRPAHSPHSLALCFHSEAFHRIFHHYEISGFFQGKIKVPTHSFPLLSFFDIQWLNIWFISMLKTKAFWRATWFFPITHQLIILNIEVLLCTILPSNWAIVGLYTYTLVSQLLQLFKGLLEKSRYHSLNTADVIAVQPYYWPPKNNREQKNCTHRPTSHIRSQQSTPYRTVQYYAYRFGRVFTISRY